jgi:bifunctional non-homologous end joining protein LigD
MAKVIERASLFYCKGSSDKVYHVELREADGSYSVAVAYGRRDGSLQNGTKASGVSEASARATFQAIVREKVAKDYELSDGESETAIAVKTAHDGKRARVDVQLLTPISRDDQVQLDRLLDDPRWALMQKHDGERRFVEINAGGEIVGINRKGLYVALPRGIVANVSSLPAGTILDGEIIGDAYFLFDLIAYAGDESIKERSFESRHTLLEEIVRPLAGTNFTFVPAITDPEAKRRYFAELLESGAEGAVFVLVSAPYTVGKSKIALKCKFYETASVLVSALNDIRSVAMSAYDKGQSLVFIGSVTVPPSVDKDALLGRVIEVRYRHINAPGGGLIEPVFLAIRSDIDPIECTTEQLYYKNCA